MPLPVGRSLLVLGALFLSSAICLGDDAKNQTHKALVCGSLRKGEVVKMKGLSKAWSRRGLKIVSVRFKNSDPSAAVKNIEEAEARDVLSIRFMSDEHSRLGMAYMDQGKITNIVCEEPSSDNEDAIMSVND